MISKEQYIRLQPHRELINSYIKYKTLVSANLDVIGQIYMELGYHYKAGCSGCVDIMMNDINNFLTKYERENGKKDEQKQVG